MFQLINTFSSRSNREYNLLEVSTLVLSHFSWKHFQNDNVIRFTVFLYHLINVISTILTSINFTVPTLGYLAVIMSNLFHYRSKELRNLLYEVYIVLALAQDRASYVVVESVFKCFEYVMESFFKSDEDIGEVRNIHKMVECLYSSLFSEVLDDNTVYSLCATIVYYWCTVERMVTQSPILEKEVTLVLVRFKLCEIQRNVTDNNLLRSVTELMQLLLSLNEGAAESIMKERERDELIIPFIPSRNKLYNKIKKIRRATTTTIHINIQQANCHQSIALMCFEPVTPPPYLQQKQEITFIDVPLQKGEHYLIATRWFKQWKRYVGYDDCHMSKTRDARPGPIDNTSLLDQGKLRRGQVDGIDYELVQKKLGVSCCLGTGLPVVEILWGSGGR